MSERKRWKAVIRYAYMTGDEIKTVEIEELEELQDIIEHGPDWRTMAECTITHNMDHEEVGK
ncbi:hypothetical protein ACXHXM_17805|nr:hypothetical protein [Rhizobium altiplani]